MVVLLLSKGSWPGRWPRERWEPILFDKTQEAGAELFSLLLEDCAFPPLLRRRNFVDAMPNPLTAMRSLKRWLWNRQAADPQVLNSAFSGDLEDLYAILADQPGTLRTSGAEASRFVKEASQEFEAVIWIACHERSLAQIVGELGAQLGLPLEGPVAQNCRRVQDLLASRRCLLVLDSPATELAAAVIPSGRTSTLVTSDPVEIVQTPKSLAEARKLISVRRYAEAYELLYRLLDADISPADCARELAWICEYWDELDEAESLRFHYRLPPTEQLSLF